MGETIPIPGVPRNGDHHSRNTDVTFRISVLLDCLDCQISLVMKLTSAESDISVPDMAIAIHGHSMYGDCLSHDAHNEGEVRPHQYVKLVILYASCNFREIDFFDAASVGL